MRWIFASILSCLLLLVASTDAFLASFEFNKDGCQLMDATLFMSPKDKSDDDVSSCPGRRSLLLSTAATAIAAASASPAPAMAAATVNSVAAAEYSDYFDPVVPFSTRRQYKTITLAANGLRVLLVSDKETFRSAAALSIQHAGQFAEPTEVPGLAHLMEHIVLSSSTKSTNPFGRKSNFEDWLEDKEGASNAFTAYDSVCFHFSGPSTIFAEALNRFAALFVQETVVETCRDAVTVKREIRRVDAELDYTSDVVQAFYLSKEVINPEHPFSRFGAGNLETLEKIPARDGINVGNMLIEFFENHYLPSQAVLVVVSPADLSSLERWAAPFANSLSRKAAEGKTDSIVAFPEPFPIRSKLAQMVLFRANQDSPLKLDNEKLTFEWPLKINYEERTKNGLPMLAAPAVGFVISQILARRGPGSLYLFLLRRGWVPKGNQGLPRISFPVDVSGFQLMKLEIGLTLAGFANRSAVIAAVYDSIRKTSRICQPPRSFLLPPALLRQYVNTAWLYGYVLAPRPPDAVELTMDAQRYGLSEETGVGSASSWPIFPSVEDPDAMEVLQRLVADMLEVMNDPTKVIIMMTASNKAIETGRSVSDDSLPQVSSPSWQVEPSAGGRYYVESTSKFPGFLEAWVAERLDEDELLPPVINPLVPARLRPPRAVTERSFSDGSSRVFYRERPGDTIWREFVTQAPGRPNKVLAWEDRSLNSLIGPDWKLWQSPTSSSDFPKLPLPAAPLEPTCRAAFVVQLLSSRPPRANVKQAAHAQLWVTSFHAAVSDLVRFTDLEGTIAMLLRLQLSFSSLTKAELGAPAGLAYDVTFNKYGLRMCFLGISQNIASYARRLCRRLVQHQKRLLLEQGPNNSLDPSIVEATISDANRALSMSPLRKRRIIGALKDATIAQVSSEGSDFFQSCSGGVCLAQGDILPREAIGLVNDLQRIFSSVMLKTDALPSAPATPNVKDILYKPMWKPRSASICMIPGISLVSNACGRIQR